MPTLSFQELSCTPYKEADLLRINTGEFPTERYNQRINNEECKLDWSK